MAGFQGEEPLPVFEIRDFAGPGSDLLIRDSRLGAALAQSLGVDDKMALHILRDETGTSLAVACKGANIDRAAFSALALLTRPGRDRMHTFAVLDAFDTVPTSEATRVLRGWREGQQTAA